MSIPPTTDRSRPRIGISLRAGDAICPAGTRSVLGYARVADQLGFDDFDAPDHVVLSAQRDDYPGGTWGWSEASNWPDPFVVLAAVAAATEHLTLTTSVLVAPLRPAVVIAKMAATLDDISNGRFRMGLGSGWLRAEFEAAGVPFARRTARLEDTVGACRALWSAAPASFSSETVSFSNVYCSPRPCNPRGVPILIGGAPTESVADRVSRIGDGWTAMQVDRDEFASGARLVHQAFERRDRDPRDAIIRVPVPEEIVRLAYERDQPAVLKAEVDELARAGATDVKIYLSGAVDTASGAEACLEWLAGCLGLDRGHRR